MTLPEWQRGYDLGLLKQFTAVFDAHDEGMVRSRFGRTSERTVAEALERGGLRAVGYPPTAAVIWKRATSSRWVRDFTGEERVRVEPGDFYVYRMAGPHDEVLRILGELQRENTAQGEAATWWFETWTESAADRELLEELEAEPVATKIRASSEMIQVSGVGYTPPRVVPLEPADVPSLCRLSGSWSAPAEELLRAFEGLEAGEFADHYSVYGKGRSWGALSLRGYGPAGEPADPNFIIKPSDMAKSWKAEHAEKLEWQPEWTALGEDLARELVPFVEGLGELDRVRLMRLAPGDGEIERHADIVDREAGTSDGKVVRLHFPVRTNESVIFWSWGLDGQEYTGHMGLGECWYLDIRKPHAVINLGDEERIHLVVDVRSSPLLRARLLEAEHAQKVQPVLA